MSDIERIFWTTFATLIGGVIIYVIGRTIEKFVLEPLQEYRKTRANINDILIFYANIYSNTDDSLKVDKEEASKALRKLSADLFVKTQQIPFYNFFVKINVISSYKNSLDAASELMGFSNSLWQTDFNQIENRRKKIETLLHIKT